jgi:hypothetical protein
LNIGRYIASSTEPTISPTSTIIGLLADRHHAHGHIGEDILHRQGSAEGDAFAHLVFGIDDRITDDAVVGGFPHDFQRHQNRHTSPRKRTQCAAELGGGRLLHQLTKQGHLEHQAIDLAPAGRSGIEAAEQEAAHNQAAHKHD